MSKHPAFTGKILVAALKRAGFIVDRTKGSHAFLKHYDGRATVVSVHAGETIGSGLLSKILRDVEMTRDDLHKLFKKSVS